ncbi:aldo/keto reductase [Epibacterium sp. SM1979]|uniref:Aldo/keto reductase n=1 Tax=Tritonibacter litoralis TaxID=2662264 RepID=A0A843YHN4_9RHOB|nr:aldo/keto reductase [Tritonibacter litoralis]MQQ09185.1 aldo/keto reductase [Tritonibacter litoralis]
MQYRKLGTSDLNVSRICLGTMTWGVQNTYEEAAAQMDLALEHGVNFWDTAEIYPVPPTNDTAGRTEEIIGQWFEATGRRDEVLIATKMAGPAPLCRGRGLTPADVEEAVDGSLKRLKTDVIDLYQLHWPQRQTNTFAQRDFQPFLHTSDCGEDIEGMLEALGKMVEKGKIREIGVSNETSWGIMKYLKLAEEKGLPRIQSSQNPYSLLQRNWDTSTAEVAMQERVDLLAYSPLAGGILSGKYLDGMSPQGARFDLPWGQGIMNRHYSNRDSVYVRQYVDLAKDHGLTPTQLAIAFVNSRPYLGSNIIGATSVTQLEEILSAEDVTLSEEVLDAIEELHNAFPSPSLGREGPSDNRR